nr:G5 domain-containing protein [Anaerolineaceae bacterium]
MIRTRSFSIRSISLACIFASALLNACSPAVETPDITFDIAILVDGNSLISKANESLTVEQILSSENILTNNLDIVDPPLSANVSQNTVIRIKRVSEEFEIKETVIPFETQTVRNETMPEGQTLLIQPGKNGIRRITYRTVFEDSLEVSHSIFKSETIEEAKPEILMVGVQTPHQALSISGKIVYLSSGNAWLIETDTGNRKPLITSGDLDGYIFELSESGNWLLYTRNLNDASEDTINQLWVKNISDDDKPFYLRIDNIIHYAGWAPWTDSKIYFSTVEPRETAPGWQANNDLQSLTFNGSGVIIEKKTILESNSGGIYGWWGTSFQWASDGSNLAYARPDSVGLIDFESNSLIPLANIIPFQTRSDWAWVPHLAWSPDSNFLYTITHASDPEFSVIESSPFFNLSAINIEFQSPPLDLIPQTGMFSSPVLSPFDQNGDFRIAYLQAIFPEQSD